jgi:hypothetical protein
MLDKRIGRVLAFAVAASLALPLAWAQGEPTTRVVGTLERIDGANLVVNTGASERVVALGASVPLFAMVKASAADVKTGVFVGVGATPQPDDSQHAIRVMIFPESMRGLGEGHRPWDRPGTTMTNATVDTAVTSVDGPVVTVKYKGGEKKIVIRPDTVILTYVAAEKSELKPGARVAVTGVVRTGGAIEARRVVVGRDGVIPT